MGPGRQFHLYLKLVAPGYPHQYHCVQAECQACTWPAALRGLVCSESARHSHMVSMALQASVPFLYFENRQMWPTPRRLKDAP